MQKDIAIHQGEVRGTQMDDLWLPESAVKETHQRYSVTCRCGNQMRVRMKHFGRMCRCTKCRFPIYVTYDNVDPPVSAADREVARVFKENEVPVHWQKGDLLMGLYEVRDTLGEGGMGVVYQVYHRGWGMHLAVKCPAPKLLGDPDWLDQFEHECETWINLSPHPNIVQCYYVRRLAGIPRVFVEFVKGLDLAHMIEHKTLYAGGHDGAMERMLDISIQYCRGLHHAHQQGVVHQDVKPGNLLIGEENACKVTDFGLAKVWVYEDGSKGSSRLDGSSRGSGTDALKMKGLSGGTPTYRSDDHKRFGDITHKTDIWSWGVSMIEMFAGDIYWKHGRDARSVLDNLLTHGSRYDIIPRMPKRFEALLYRCFEEEPAMRPNDMHDIALELQIIYAEETGKSYPRPEADLGDPTLDVLNNRAVSMLDLGKSDEAGQLWAEVIEMQPDFIEAIYNQNLHHWKAGRITDAEMVEIMSRLREDNPKAWLPAYLLGRVLIERGDAAAALKLLENIPEDAANRREVAYGLAMAQNSLGRDRKLTWEFKPESTNVSAVSLSFDGWHALTGGDDGQIRIWEVASRKCTAVLDGHTARIHAVSLSEEERLALSASADKTLRVWDPISAKCLLMLSGHQGPVRAAALTPNAKHALSGSEDGTLMLWDVKTGKRLRVFMGHRGSVNAVAITRCGNYAVSASSDCTLKQWDLWTGKCLRTFEGNNSRTTSVCVSQDGSLMLSACDMHLQLWSLETGELIRNIRGHSAEIFTVCLNESGQYALSATGMGTIKVWDIQSGQCLRSLQGHAPAALSRDGRYAISIGKKGDFKIWAIHIGEPPFPAQYVLCKGSQRAAQEG